MESNLKLVLGAAVVGMFLGIAGLIFAVVSKNQSDELRNDFSLVNDLREKLEEVENSSSGVSAGAVRIQREVESLRSGTQGALDQVSSELTRLRQDLNETLAFAKGMQDGFRGLQERLGELEQLPLFAAEPEPEPVAEVADVAEQRFPAERQEVADVAVAESPQPEQSAAEEIYLIRSGDTLSSVASAHGISLNKILEANADVDPRRLQVGQPIRVPVR